MSNKIKMVVFDMAGTTVNEDNVVYKTLRTAINEAGFDFTLDQVLEQGAGNEKLQAIKKVLKAYANIDDDKLANAIYDKFIVQLANAYSTLDVLPQPNATDLFAALKAKGILTVLNTGYNRETAQSLIDKLGWKEGNEYDLLVTATDVQASRPKPDMIWFAMEKFGITDAGEVAKVGDSIIDIEEGENAGCSLNIGITTGAHTYEQLESAKPGAIIDNLMEVLKLVG
jgi:phosphonatase-like hydrolase